MRVELHCLHEVSEDDEVPGVSVGGEGETPHAFRDDIPCQWLGYADSFHHQLCVNVPQDIGHGAAAQPPHLMG